MDRLWPYCYCCCGCKGDSSLVLIVVLLLLIPSRLKKETCKGGGNTFGDYRFQNKSPGLQWMSHILRFQVCSLSVLLFF